MDVNSVLIFGVPAVATITAIVKVARETGLPSKYAPAVSLGIGVAIGVGIALQTGDLWVTGLPIGVILGASSCGIYDLGKKSTENTQIGA
jgi:hypothetical protein